LATLVDHMAEMIEGLFKDLDSCRRDPVRTAAGVRIESLDETTLVESSHRLVQGPRPEANTGEALDVLHQSMAVLRTSSQAGENEEAHAADDVVFSRSIGALRSHALIRLRSAELREE
jgi:hypothetical protein